MRLICLSCDRPSFKPLVFRPSGLSVLVGDAQQEQGSSNGVGKTLALRLVHHCLEKLVRVLECSAFPAILRNGNIYQLTSLAGTVINPDQSQNVILINYERSTFDRHNPHHTGNTPVEPNHGTGPAVRTHD